MVIIVKFHDVGLRVKGRAFMGLSNRIPVGITSTAGSSSPQKDSTAWYQNFGTDIIVTNFWGDFKVTVVRVNAVSILPIMDVFRH